MVSNNNSLLSTLDLPQQQCTPVAVSSSNSSSCPHGYSSPFVSNYDFLKHEDPDFRLTDSILWGPPTNTPTDELAPKPKAAIADDPCGCCRPKWEDLQSKSKDELMQCRDLSCVLFACLEECRSNCQAGEYCANKRIQRREWKKLEVFETTKKGLGLRVLEDVQKGELVTEYVGKAVNKLYLNRLFKRYANERKLYIMAITNDIYLDARKVGGVARYINHSCDPNCQVERWKVKGIMRAAVVARRDIPKGTELSFDYQWERKRGRAPTKCYCGAANCRQTLEVSRSMEEEEIERKLSQHWKKPMISRAGKEIVNRCIKLFSKEAQDYYPADVVQYDESNGKHLLMYRHDLDEVWEDLKTEDWMILDEEAEQFIIRKKRGGNPRKSLIGGNAQSGILLQGNGTTNYVYTQTRFKEALFDRHLIERCQRSCKVTIKPEPFTRDTIEGEPNSPEYEARLKALKESTDGTIWKMLIAGSDVPKAREILEKNISFLVSKAFESKATKTNPSAAAAGVSETTTLEAAWNSTEFVFPRTIVDSIKRRLPNLRERCKAVNISFAPSDSKSKQFAKLVVEGDFAQDVEASKEILWKQLNLACEEQNLPKTPLGIFQDLGMLGGQLSSTDFHRLLGTKGASKTMLSRKHDAKEDLSQWSPFFTSFEAAQKCSIWVQAESDMGRISKDNRVVKLATPHTPRKLYFGCEPKMVSTLWKLMETRALEMAKGVLYLHLGHDRIYLPQMMGKNGRFFEFVKSVASATVTIDSVTGDHLRIDGDDPKTLKDDVGLAEELVRLQIELYKDHCIRQANWIFGRDWVFARRSARLKNDSAEVLPSGRPTSSFANFDSKSLANACLDIADICSSLGLGGNVAAHATIILYRFVTVVSLGETQLKVRELLLTCVFLANKSQKGIRWKKLSSVLEAAYEIFYPGVKFDASKEESLVWEEKVISAESEILERLNHDIFCGGFDWIVAAAVDSGAMDSKLANHTLALSISGPLLAVGPDLWLTYGEEYIFAACAAFLDAKFENLFTALSLIPIKVYQTAEIIEASIQNTGLGKKQLLHHPISKEGRKGLRNRLPAIKTLCAFLMTNKQGMVSISPSETEMRYKIIKDRTMERRVYQNVPTTILQAIILPSIDGISAESKCSIFIDKSPSRIAYDIILEGSWRALSIASHLLNEIVGDHSLGEPIDSKWRNQSDDPILIQAKANPGVLSMKMIQEGWSNTIESDSSNQSVWGRKTGGKSCVPGKIKAADMRQGGLRWWIPPNYGPSTTGSLCDMFLNEENHKMMEALQNLSHGSQGESESFTFLSSKQKEDDRFLALSLHRWPAEKVAFREQLRAKKEAKKAKNSKRTVRQVGFSPSALQEMQTLRQLHGLIKSPQGHPNLYLPVGIALPSKQTIRENDHGSNGQSNGFDLKKIDEDIFSLTRTSLENEAAARQEKERKEMANDRHLVMEPTPFILQRFIQKKRKDEHPKLLSQTIFANWCFDLLSAVLHCHENGIVLRGTLNLDQIVVDHSGVAKIGSFYKTSVLGKGESKQNKNIGLLKQAREKKKELDRRKKENPKYVSDEQDDILKDPYVPPEMLLGSPKYTMETDMWALGCLLSHLLLNKPIYSGKENSSRQTLLAAMYKFVGIPSLDNFELAVKFPYYKKPEKKYRPGVEKAIPRMMKEEKDAAAYASAIDLIRQMLQLDPEKRITAKQALQHEYMSTYMEGSSTRSFQETFVKDWMFLKNRLAKSTEDETKAKERGIKRKAMLMAASRSSASALDDDGLYDMADILGIGGTKLPKIGTE